MGTLSWVWIVTVSSCLITFIHTIPLEIFIDCTLGTSESLGEVDEGYSGDLETIPNVPDVELVLEAFCPRCEEFLELSFITSITNATVRTKKPLDAEALRETNGFITYQITCIATGVTNGRTLFVRDVNEHPPVFDKEEYRAEVLETLNVGEVVIQVKATDADLTPDNNLLTYSIQPPTTTFEVNGYGEILLKEHLNSTDIRQYILTVKAQDGGGLFNETRVIINIIDKVDLMFEYDVYEASIPEYQLGPLLEVLPAPIKANGTGNRTVIYTIREIFPNDYWRSFTIDQSTGVIKVVTELDFEEIKDPVIIHIQASLENDSTRTANATVTVHVKNVNIAPVFNAKLFTAEIFSTALTNQHVVKVEAIDPDVGDTLQYSLVTPSSMFAVEPSSGQVYVVSAAGESGKVNLQVKAEDQGGLYDTTTVEVTIKESDSKDVVLISVNQETGTVQNKTAEMEEALERALGWSVTIISVSNSRQDSSLSHTPDIHSVHRENAPRTLVSFIATEINGTNVIPKDTVQTKLVDDKEKVLEELQQVFGQDVDYDVEDYDVSPGIDITAVVCGTVIPGICIGGAIAVFCKYRETLKRRSTDSDLKLPKKLTDICYGDAENEIGGTSDLSSADSDTEGKQDLAEDRKSIGGRPDLSEDRKSIGGRPDLVEDRKSMGGRPDLSEDRKSIGGRPDLVEDRKSMGGRPDLTKD